MSRRRFFEPRDNDRPTSKSGRWAKCPICGKLAIILFNIAKCTQSDCERYDREAAGEAFGYGV